MSGGAITPALAPARSRRAWLGRGLAMLLLPASIVPVPFLGPTLLRAPRRLYRQAAAEIHRLEYGTVQRRGPLPAILGPLDVPAVSPAERRGRTVALPSRRIPR